MESFGRKKATINQVAAKAGVSVTTVSLYLGGRTRVCSVETARRIDKAVAELKYQPNPLAGSAYNKSRRTIGLLASGDLERGPKPWAVYNMKILNGILQVANEANYAILAYPFRVFLDNQYRAVLDGRVDGILFYGSGRHDIVRQLCEAKMPIVCYGQPEEIQNCAGVVYSDERLISQMAVGHLWELGHRRIAHLAGPYRDCVRSVRQSDGSTKRIPELAEPVSEARRLAAQMFLARLGAYDPDLFSEAHAWHEPDVAPSMQRWMAMKDLPTAIYCANDYIGWKAIEWARAHCIRIPDDLAIIGVDNIEGPNQECFLSSVEPSIEEIGRQAMLMIFDILSGASDLKTVREVAPNPLIIRNSTVRTG